MTVIIINTEKSARVLTLPPVAPKPGESAGLNRTIEILPKIPKEVSDEDWRAALKNTTVKHWVKSGQITVADRGEEAESEETGTGAGGEGTGTTNPEPGKPAEVEDIATARVAAVLRDNGFDIAAIAEAEAEKLEELEGIGNPTALRLIGDAKAALASQAEAGAGD